MRDEDATAAARGDVAGPVSQVNAIDFCQANDLICPESIDGREKKMPLLVVM